MISRDDWLAALAAATGPMPENDPDAMTTMELAAMFQCAETTMRRKLKTLLGAGKAEQVAKHIQKADGTRCRVNAWRLKQ